MSARSFACVSTLLAASCCSATSWAAPYSFVKIVGASGAASLSDQVVINNRGAIAFARIAPSGVQTLYTSGGGKLTKIADTAGPIAAITAWDLNFSGTVAYEVEFDYSTTVPWIPATAVFTGNGKTTKTIIKSNDQIFRVGGGPINDKGQVAIQITSESDDTAVVTRSPARLIAASTSEILAVGDINNSGTVAFATITVEDRIYVGSGGPVTLLARTEGTEFLFFLSPPRINNAGKVAFRARLDNDGVGLYVADKNGIRTIVDNVSGPFAGLGLGAPAINNHGSVAFIGHNQLFDGIYLGPNPSSVPIIQVGDPLDGSTIQRLSTGEVGRFLNDAGQIAFWAQLADGRTGIYRADPVRLIASAVPEPSVLALFFTTIALSLSAHRLRFS